MITTDNILDKFSGVALWCSADIEATDLANVASVAIEKNIPCMSVAPGSVSILWPWLENKNVKIFSRFYFDSQNKDGIDLISENINQVFKHGADGTQIFVSMRDLNEFVSQLYLIRDDLFFNKDVFIGLDINEIGPFDWPTVFVAIKKMRATGLTLAMTRDDGDKSDFVGRIYAALSYLDEKKENIPLHFVCGVNETRIEQAQRLIQAMRPEMVGQAKFFINI